MRALLLVFLVVLTGCWPSRISFVDGNMPEEWKSFHVETLELNAPNSPLSYAANLSEAVKDGVMNNTRLLLSATPEEAEIAIQGVVSNYLVSPVALQEGDNAAQNRLTISVNFEIFISKPEEDLINLTSTRFVDYNSNLDLASVEAGLLEEINTQIVQDVINKLLSNW